MAPPRGKPQTIAFVPQGTNQARGSRSLPLGSLVEATNVRQVKEDEWRKRRGFARTVPSTVGGGGYGNGSRGSVYAGALVEQEQSGQYWAYSADLATRNYRGIFGNGSGVRPFPTYRDAGIEMADAVVGNGTRRSVTVLGANNDVWVFSVGNGQFQYTVTGSDGEVKKAPTLTTSAGAQQLSAAYHPGQGRVYVLVLDGGTLVSSYSFNSTTYAFVGSAAYQAGLTGAASIDMQYLTSPAEVAVVIASYQTAVPRCRVTQSYLDPATLAPKGAPAAVNFDSTPNANRPDFCGGVNILIGTGLTSWYYSFWRASATATTLELMLATVTTSTLATASSTQMTTLSTAAGQDYRGVTSGYVDTGNGNRVVFAQTSGNNFDTQRSYDLSVSRYTWNGSGTTPALVARGAWLASKPCLLNSAWYFLTGREGGYNFYVGAGNDAFAFRQGDLYLRDSDGNILSQALPGNGPFLWHNWSAPPNDGGAPNQIQAYEPFVTSLLSPAANVLSATVGRMAELLFSQRPVTVSWNFAAGYGPPVAVGDLAVFPGPVPMATGPKDFLAELFPLHPPPVGRVTFGAAGGSGTSATCATYRFIRSGQVIYETSPSRLITGTYFFTDGAVAVPTLKHQMTSGVTAQICFYSAPAGSSLPVLQGVKPNNPTVDSISFSIWPHSTDFPGLAPLYTNGGGLSNATVPPARSIEKWRDRLHLSGTPVEGEVWHSQEIVDGAAPTFNEVLRSNWNDAAGPILGLKAIDWNYMAAFKRNGVGVIGGPGPDGRGQGPYTWQTLTTEKGLSDTGLNSLLSTPYGAAFQNEADGRICLVSTGLQVQDIMQGGDSYRSLLVGACLLNEPERQAWFYCTDGTLLVLEYAWAGEAKSLVNCWRKWSTSNLLRAYGAVMTPTGPLHIESDGVVRTQSGGWTDGGSGGGVDILMALETSRLAPFGMMQEGAVVGAHVLGQHISNTSAIRVTITCDDGAPSVHTYNAANPFDNSMRPTGGFRCKEVRVRIEETSSGVEGIIFEGIALDVVPYGRTRILPVGQRIP